MIYADYNATTPMGVEARTALLKASDYWGNPSSSHQEGRKARELLEESRHNVAVALGTEPSEIIFTSGGSEASVTVLLGHALSQPGLKLITSRVEHSSIKDCLPLMQRLGTEVTFARCLSSGELDLTHFEKLVRETEPDLVSFMTANNETGVLFPMPEIVKICRGAGVLVHTDAVQAFGKIPLKFFNDADFVSVSAHKIYGPKGVGALVIRGNHKFTPTHYGGSQEIKRRGGTENFIGISAFGAACTELSPIEWRNEIQALRDEFENEIKSTFPDVHIQGILAPRLPNTSNIRFPGISADILLTALDLEGICISAGSACSSGSVTPSHVLVEMGLTPSEAKECLRISFGRWSSRSETAMIAQSLVRHVNRIRGRRKT